MTATLPPYLPTREAVLQDMAARMDLGTKLCNCCGELHSAAMWYQLPRVGVQVVPADEYGPEERLELRNCRCGSTLARLEDA